MSRVIEAKVVISGEDRTGAMFDSVAKKMATMGRGAKASAEVAKLTKSLDDMKRAAGAVDTFRKAHEGFAGSRSNLRGAQADVAGIARSLDAARRAVAQMDGGFVSRGNAKTIAETGKKVADLERAYAQAQRAVRSAATAFEHQATAVKEAKGALSASGLNVTRLVADQNKLKGSIEATTAAFHKQVATAERRQARREAYGMMAAGAGLYGAHKVQRAGRDVLHTYREFDKERRFGKAVMGLTDEEQKPLVDQAIHLGATTKFNDIQVLEAQRELAARGLSKDQVLGLIQPASDLGMALDLKLPDAVKQMEGAIFGFKKDIGSLDAAMTSARQTADVQTKAAKVSGMTPEDITQAYKYGATPARMSGVSEETLLAFAGISKKANMGGDESGVAFRALIASGMSPTRKAKEAYLANGMDFRNYQKNPERLALDPFAANVAAQYGVKLNAGARAGLGAIFENKALINDPAKFTPAVLNVLEGALGKQDAKSKRSIAGAANRYRDASMQGVDMNALIRDLMVKIPGNLQLANSVFGSKQGGRIATALGDPETFKKLLDALGHTDGFAGKIATERMAGFDGAVSRLEGATKNLWTAVGRAFDRDGSGGALTGVTDYAGKFVQSLAEMNTSAIQAGTALTAVGTALVTFKSLKTLAGGFGLAGSATALTGAAEALTVAAGRLGVGGAAGGAGAAAGGAGAAAGGALGLGVTAGGVILGGTAAAVFANEVTKNEDFADAYLDGGMLGADPAGYGFGAAILHAPRLRARQTTARTPGLDAAGNLGERGAIGRMEMNTPRPPRRPMEFGGGDITVPLPPAVRAPVSADFSDQKALIGNTLERALGAMEARFGGGKPLEATLKPDQITARVTEPVKVEVEQKGAIDARFTVTVDGPGRVTNSFVMGSGGVRASSGRSMPGASNLTRGTPGDAY